VNNDEFLDLLCNMDTKQMVIEEGDVIVNRRLKHAMEF
jgi:hypothetical protein